MSTGMQNISRGSVFPRSPSTGIIVSETIHDHVLYWPIPRDQHSFRHAYSHFGAHEIAAAKISQIEVRGLLDGLRVLLEPIQQRRT